MTPSLAFSLADYYLYSLLNLTIPTDAISMDGRTSVAARMRCPGFDNERVCRAFLPLQDRFAFQSHLVKGGYLALQKDRRIRD
jgi:hypothetical protein